MTIIYVLVTLLIVIKNINFQNLSANFSDDSGVFANQINDATLTAISLFGSVTTDLEDSSSLNISGIASSISESNFKDIVVAIQAGELNYVSIKDTSIYFRETFFRHFFVSVELYIRRNHI